MMVALSNRGAWPWTIKIRFSRRQQNANLGTKGNLPAPSRRAAETCLVDQEQVASRGTNARPMFNLAIDSKLRACDVVALKVEDILWTPGAHAQTPRGLFRKTEMSDVGQEQTCRLQFPMSALPPKAAAAFVDRRVRFGP
jgi:hypothetical protein